MVFTKYFPLLCSQANHVKKFLDFFFKELRSLKTIAMKI